jgi:hypothetical protein
MASRRSSMTRVHSSRNSGRKNSSLKSAPINIFRSHVLRWKALMVSTATHGDKVRARQSRPPHQNRGSTVR